MVVDKEKEGDRVVEYEGARVLVMGEGLIDLLEGATIDFQDNAEDGFLLVSTEGR